MVPGCPLCPCPSQSAQTPSPAVLGHAQGPGPPRALLRPHQGPTGALSPPVPSAHPAPWLASFAPGQRSARPSEGRRKAVGLGQTGSQDRAFFSPLLLVSFCSLEFPLSCGLSSNTCQTHFSKALLGAAFWAPLTFLFGVTGTSPPALPSEISCKGMSLHGCDWFGPRWGEAGSTSGLTELVPTNPGRWPYPVWGSALLNAQPALVLQGK